MSMKRRTFLRSAAAAGLSIGIPFGLPVREAHAAGYTGPCFLFVHAQGGWDPRFLFDPTLEPSQNRLYSERRELDGIPYAAIPLDFERLGLPTDQALEMHVRSPEGFLTTHAKQLLVVNGIDTATNNHDAGQRAMASGHLPDGYPALASLIAAEYGGSMPMAFLSGGGYDNTNGLVPLSRITDPGTLARIARPNDINPDQAETEHFHSPATMARILDAQRARTAALYEQQRLPRLRASIEALRAARETKDELGALLLQDELVSLPGGLGDLQQMERQAQLALTAFASGLSVCASVTLGGFDTHGDHDRAQTRQLFKLLGGVDFILSYAAQKQLTSRLVVVVTSDFARGPEYNSSDAGGGKDHWPISSALLIGAGIRGGRVVGATDAGQRPLKVDPSTLALSDSGVVLSPAHLHRGLRKLAGIADSTLAAPYPIAEPLLPILG
jgi:uncharacterized protein (DUF1501 family)